MFLQSAVQDLDYENELELLYAVVTLPEGEETAASLCFIDDLTGHVTKTIALPTWNHVRDTSSVKAIEQYVFLDKVIVKAFFPKLILKLNQSTIFSYGW